MSFVDNCYGILLLENSFGVRKDKLKKKINFSFLPDVLL